MELRSTDGSARCKRLVEFYWPTVYSDVVEQKLRTSFSSLDSLAT
jgi:hypothetical protein